MSTTSIVQLDSSPKPPRRKQNIVTGTNTTPRYVKSMSQNIDTKNFDTSIDHGPYGRYAPGLPPPGSVSSSRQSYHSRISSPSSSAMIPNHGHHYSTLEERKSGYVFGGQERASALNNLTPESQTVDNYYPLSQCLSHSESGSLQNLNTSSFKSSDRSCDRFGFFLDDESENDFGTPSIQELKEIRMKEKKWLEMLNNWRYYINFKWDKIRDRCRKGIPHSLRSQAWYHLCGAHLQRNQFPTLYQELLSKDISEEIKNDICKDLHRQFPNHEMFVDPNGLGQTDLYNVLKAFATYKPQMGYCQAQAPIAAVFLMHMTADRAFWCLVALSKYYINGYFTPNLEDIQIHGQMLQSFTKKYCHSAYNLLRRQNIEPIIYMTEWFMCIYSRNLPWPSVLRVWDMFLCEGITILFKVALYLIEVALKNETTKTCPTMYETCQKLRNIPKEYLNEETLIRGIKKYDLKDLDLLREHKIQMKKFHKSKITKNAK